MSPSESTSRILQKLLAVRETSAHAIKRDRSAPNPAAVLSGDKGELLIELLHADGPNPYEEPIKKLLSEMPAGEPVYPEDHRRMLAAFDYAASPGRLGSRVKKLRRQYLKTRRTKLD